MNARYVSSSLSLAPRYLTIPFRSRDVATPRSLLDVRVDLLCLLPMLLGCGLFLTCALCLLLSCKPCLIRLPASRLRLLAVRASFDALLIELSRTLAPRDERHNGQNDDHCNGNQND